MTGAELSTGNCLIMAAWVNRSIELKAMLRVLGQSYLTNVLGALGLVMLVSATGLLQAERGRVVVNVTRPSSHCRSARR